ncbi:hypothetical protein ACIA59_24390 [Micromonospora haikouensis]|uniref:hypothetical protein n=1 Tax=Micromonospora haikouensis TaxID=686309 RepID=UPI003790F776
MPDTTGSLPDFNSSNRAYLRFFDLLPDLWQPTHPSPRAERIVVPLYHPTAGIETR